LNVLALQDVCIFVEGVHVVRTDILIVFFTKLHLVKLSHFSQIFVYDGRRFVTTSIVFHIVFFVCLDIQFACMLKYTIAGLSKVSNRHRHKAYILTSNWY